VKEKLLVVQVAALGYEFFTRWNGGPAWNGLTFHPAESVFPALTCPVQATIRTALPPSLHGMTMNGVYLPALRRPFFWEQSSALVKGTRIWEGARGRTVGMLFWQQSLGEEVDVLLSPAPIHTHGGGLVEDVYARPEGLYGELVRLIGRRFRLSSYWGPLASAASSRWITEATIRIMADPRRAPDVLFTYLPHLDYALQKHGPRAERSGKALAELRRMMEEILRRAASCGYEVVIFGDYAIEEVRHVLHPNRVLAESGLLALRRVKGRLYPDFHYSRAFAVADHQVARIYTRDREAAEEAAVLFTGREGVAEVSLPPDRDTEGGCVLTADRGFWFAYPWWHTRREAPDYATHVDIHNKPGYDPCELFFGRHPFVISTDPGRVKGSHGRTGPGYEVCVAATFSFPAPPRSLLDLSRLLRSLVTGEGDMQ